MKNSIQYDDPVRNDEVGYSVLLVQEEKTESNSGEKRGTANLNHIPRAWGKIPDDVFLHLLSYVIFKERSRFCVNKEYTRMVNKAFQTRMIDVNELLGTQWNLETDLEAPAGFSEEKSQETKTRRLPNEGLYHILRFLSLKEKGRLMATNKSWRRFIGNHPAEPQVKKAKKAIEILNANRFVIYNNDDVDDPNIINQNEEIMRSERNRIYQSIQNGNVFPLAVNEEFRAYRNAVKWKAIGRVAFDIAWLSGLILGVVWLTEGWGLTKGWGLVAAAAILLSVLSGGCGFGIHREVILEVCCFSWCFCFSNMGDIKTAIQRDPTVSSIRMLISGVNELNSDDEELELLEEGGEPSTFYRAMS